MWGQRETTVSMEYHGAVFELVKYQSYKSKTTYRVTGISKQTPLLEIPSTYKYNRMLHLFDYHRYKQTLQNAGFNHRVNIIVVDPKNTSRIGKQKYCGSRKLNIHQAAAYVIARRGQGYNDRLTE